MWCVYDSLNILKTKLLQCKKGAHKNGAKELSGILTVDMEKRERPE